MRSSSNTWAGTVGMGHNKAMRHLAGAALLLSMMLFLSALPSTPAKVADVPSVRLSLGGQGSVPWSMEAIKPGDHGTEVTVLQNTGSKDGTVLLWISNIKETDAAGDGAFLGQYMRFSIDAEGLCTEARFPCTIYELPEYPSSSSKIIIRSLPAGSSVTIHWTWEFLETGAPQNEAQGDGLSFDINYLLYEPPPAGEDYQWIWMEILGLGAVVGMNSTGHVVETVQVTDPSGAFRLTIPKGTRVVTEGGQLPSAIIMTTDAGAGGAVPDGWTKVGPAYVLSGYLEGTGTVNVLFIGQVGLTLGLDPSTVPEGTRMTSMFMLAADGQWAMVSGSSTMTSSSWEAWGIIGRTGTYTILASENASDHAFIEARDLTVRPGTSELWWPVVLATSTGKTVSVGATLTNHGDVVGNITISLFVDGEVMGSATVTLLPGESREVVLTADGLRDGDHQVRMAGLTSSFRTESTINWPAIVLVAAASWSLLMLMAAKLGRSRPEVPEAMMADRKDRVLVELGSRDLSFEELSQRTRLEDDDLLQALEVLWKEGRLGAERRDHIIYFMRPDGPTADTAGDDLNTSRTSGPGRGA